MHPTVYVGIDIIILLRHRFHHLSRFLCRCCIIEVYQRFTIYLTTQNGEIGTPPLPSQGEGVPTVSIIIAHISLPFLLFSFSPSPLPLGGVGLSPTQFAALAFTQFTTESLLYKVVQAITEWD